MKPIEYVKPASDELLEKFSRMHKRARRKINLAKYTIFPALLAGDSVGDVTLDGQIALIQPHPGAYLCLCPLKPNPQPTEQEAWFYSDCISYEHDIPVVVYPRPGDFVRFKYRYAYVEPQQKRTVPIVGADSGNKVGKRMLVSPLSAHREVKLFYTEQWLTILSEICGLKLGPLTCVLFRSPGFDKTVDLPYSKKYQGVHSEIHLYATAQRQADALSEFLCYYRVIEGATNSNGVSWISANLSQISTHDFGLIQICNIRGEPRPKSLLKIYRHRALLRLKQLMQTHATSYAIADYLYKVNRCGIAHGRRIKRSDVTPNYFELLKDTYILKMLARIAIDQRLI